ncbi:ABC transporter permease [Microbacterium gorillae]|uniref:ABC transporter permease n=1 Tax=Microbacterium gorillae TaxID=1231063 RepID=UPI0005909420|nr:ABC transporter permease [Microbacterium gorillae]
MSTAAQTRTSSPVQSVLLVAEREIRSKLESKAFIISTLVLFALALALVLFGGFSAGNAADEKTPVAVTADAASAVSDVRGLKVTDVADRAAAEKAVLDGSVNAAVVGDASSPTGFTILAKDAAPSDLMMKLAVVPTVDILQPATTDPFLRYIVALGFGMLFMMAAMTFGTTIAQSVVEEKQTRIVEILIASISTRTLMAGKVLGNTVLAMGQIIGIVVITVVGLTVTGQANVLGMLGAPLVWFAIFFLFGFILLAALYAAGAAMVSRQEDIGSTTTPLMLLVMAPYFLVVFFNDNPVVLTIMSYVPFSAPVGMPLRLFLGEAQWWEPLIALVVMLASCVLAVIVAAKIYDNSLLRMGSRVSFKEAIRG